MISAEINSDDYVISGDFDATPWFTSASDDNIIDLSGEDWCNSYSADYVYLEYPEPKPEIMTDLGTYLGLVNSSGSHETVGFEVWVSEVDAMRWLRENRAELAKKVEKYD